MFDVWTRAELRGKGMTVRQIRHALASGALVRARKGFYVSGDAPDAHLRAARIGGRLACLSLLAELGVFVFDASTLHVHMERGDSRMRTPHGGGALRPRRDRRDVVLHWRRLAEPASAGAVDIVDAVAHAVRCQEPGRAIATIDSALNTRLLSEGQLDDVFAQLPRRHQVLRLFVDGRAEAGTETLMRLILVKLGCRVEVQVRIDGVGRVDLLVDGWLVVECDSKQFHSEWAQQRTDYRRDMALAVRGYFRIRFLAEDIFYRPETVIAALRGVLRSVRRPV
ncbi:MAG: DUF559 domain-containing protein [Microbacterium sp.]|uniref:endonuclease domain-containing protein n=1 Tax=Microbacterium sp. TaxID=51671 RepID=UPI001ACD7466|nr:DUF559 domain-containing protein [Microbacterium sp.]MBN9178705.1 DUF559 domain-containing protein [Microbacterium sp.]